ncbi:MAG: hypothetical protein B0W54_19125 [Cellvibrio sp. 79]|nr:MAG: hypothetical protein B0W54_19125 [Cellvibrio sp. 79]
MRSNGIHLSLALIASLGIISLTGCGGGDGDSARVAQTVDAAKNTVTKVAIAANEQYVHYKSYYQFELIGTDEQGNKIDLTRKATWKISDPTLGEIKDGYFKAAHKAGNFTLTATYAGIAAAPQEINVSDANLQSITVQNAASSVDECKNSTFTALAKFDNGKTLPYDTNWKVTEGGTIASFKDATKGILSTKNNGSVKVVASGVDNTGKEVVSEAFTFTINEALTKITVSTDKNAEMRDDETATVTVKGIYGDANNPIDITDNSTLSADPAKHLKIEGTQITAKEGTASGATVTLKGDCGGASGSLALTIKERQATSIQIQSSSGSNTTNLSVTEGSSLKLKVVATYPDNTKNENYASKVVWDYDDTNNVIPDDKEDKISFSDTTPGQLEIDGDLDLNVASTIYVKAEVQDSNGVVINGSNGSPLSDTIDVTINRN